MGKMHKLGKDGDQELTWDPSKKIETALAGAEFESLTKNGYVAFEITKPGDEATQVDKFNPDAHEILYSRPIGGGC